MLFRSEALHANFVPVTDTSDPRKPPALGDEIIVPALDEKLKYKVPAGTQSGTVFRLKGKGMPSVRNGRKGDLYVKVNLEVPTKLTGKQKKFIRKMSEEIGIDCYNKKKGFLESVKELFK